MLSSFHSALIHRNLPVVRITSPIHDNPSYLQQLNSDSKIQNSSMVHYLVNTFEFSQEKAFTACKYLKISTTGKSELVREFLQNQGLSAKQISAIVRYYPRILSLDPEKVLLPKVEFLRSMGISQTEVKQIFSRAPDVFSRSLTKQIMPTFSYIKSLFESSGICFGFTEQLGEILRCDLESHLIPNVETLRDAGVPDSKIVLLLQINPRALMVDSLAFREVVEEVKQRNICPSKRSFIVAVRVIRSLSKSAWDAKVAAYKKWGWSEDDVKSVFQRFPYCMTISTDKITRVMNYMINEMGFDSSPMLKNPAILSLSLEKRIKPRCSVYKFLVENDLIKEIRYLSGIFNITEDKFLEKFVHPYEIQAPGLLRLYYKKMGVSKS